MARLLVFVLVQLLIAAPLFATCGGGGGGGVGGITPNLGNGQTEQVYRVPWIVMPDGTTRLDGDLVLFWFPTSPEQARSSGLQTSRNLSVWASRCVGMGVVPTDNGTLREKLAVAGEHPSAVLLDGGGEEIGRVSGDNGSLALRAVEKLVGGELEAREETVKGLLASATAKRKGGETESAAGLYRQVWESRCQFPGPAKKAAKGLKKMGLATDEQIGWRGDEADLSPATTRRVDELMTAGLIAERALRIDEAERLYRRAWKADPADPVPLRFLAELHRHHSGDWQQATELFEHLLAGPVDPLSRAVALHGLGKMTIHSGDFDRGLAYFEQSVAAFPLALTYRNLAVYWNSEAELEKAYGYVEKAMALEPHDLYNQVFAATYLVELGRPDEAERIARANRGFLEASYNLAAIHAQLGQRAEAFELLRRHFYEYERYDAVRSKEMQEARDDIVFAAYHDDPEFIALTALADGLGAAAGGR
ncbi:MAG: tetratricopeptide repeat protein [Acidobacteriota bacterium]